MGEHEQGNVRVENVEARSQHETAAKGERVEKAERETGRVEAFSDAVFAIAITLLMLDLRLPSGSENASNQELFDELIRLWPQYLAFVTSFAFIGVIWINHHRVFTLIRRIDAPLLLLNLLLLFGVTVLPFPTSVLADHLGGPGEQVAALVYGRTEYGHRHLSQPTMALCLDGHDGQSSAYPGRRSHQSSRAHAPV